MLTEKQWKLVNEFCPLVKIVACYASGRHGDLDEIESDVQFAVIMAVARFDGDPDSDRELFNKHVKYSMFRIAKGTRLRRRCIDDNSTFKTTNLTGHEERHYDFSDEKSADAIDRIIEEWGLRDLSGCMSCEEWAVVCDLVIDELSAEESSARLNITLPRVVELYNSAGHKMRGYYSRCLERRTSGR